MFRKFGVSAVTNMPEQNRRKRRPYNIFHLLARLFNIFFIIFLIFTYLLAMPLGIYFFYFTEEGATYSRQTLINGIPIVIAPFGGNPWWTPFYVMVGRWVTTGEYFAGLWFILCVCLFFTWIGQDESLRKGLSKLKDFSIPKGNYLLMFPYIASIAYSSALFLENILFPSIGVPVGPVLPNIPIHTRFLLATNSAITEEIGFRLVPLGISSLFLLVTNKQNRRFLRSISWKNRVQILMLSLLRPTAAKKKVNQNNYTKGKNDLKVNQLSESNLTKIEYFFVLISSAIFGLGHIGWGQGNAISVFLTSLIWGYVYYTYGLTGSILLHWLFNYYFTIYHYLAPHFQIIDYVYGISFIIHTLAGFILWTVLFIVTIQVVIHRMQRRKKSINLQ